MGRVSSAQRRRIWLYLGGGGLLLVLLLLSPNLVKPRHISRLSSSIEHLSRSNPISSYTLPRWDDHSRIRRSVDSREARAVVHPTLLDHLTLANAPSPWRRTSIFSAYLDRRPEVVGHPPLIQLVGTMEGKDMVLPQAQFKLEEEQERLMCWVSLRRGGHEAESFKTRTTMVGPRDAHLDVKAEVVTLFSCPIELPDGEELGKTDWEGAEV